MTAAAGQLAKALEEGLRESLRRSGGRVPRATADWARTLADVVAQGASAGGQLWQRRWRKPSPGSQSART